MWGLLTTGVYMQDPEKTFEAPPLTAESLVHTLRFPFKLQKLLT